MGNHVDEKQIKINLTLVKFSSFLKNKSCFINFCALYQYI